MLNKNILFASGDGDGCGLYRSKLPSKFLEKNYTLGFQPNNQLTKDAEIIFLQRATNEFFLEWIPKAQSEGKKIIYDIDDNLWEIPSTNYASRVYNRKALDLTKRIIQLCDAMVVSTQPLKDYFIYHRFNDNIHIIPNFIDDVFPSREHNDIITVGYYGTATHKNDFDYRLVNSLRKLKGKCKLIFVGYNPIPGMEDLYINWIESDNFHQEINKLNIDILIAPLIDNEFNKCKSNIKFLEASSMNTCFIGSDVYPYSNTILDGETGILIKNNKEWDYYLNKLIKDNFWRQNISDNARDFVRQNFTYKYNGDFIIGKYKNLLDSLK